MQIKSFLAFIALTGSAFAADCQNSPGVANGECVKLYEGGNCNGNVAVSYKPTCEGNCFQFGFNSIDAAGDGTFGTSVVIYSDNNCQNQISTIGNTIESSCGNTIGQSHKSFYRC
ncbi:uncharacterized protein PAC_04831 [Phialocephala subalpina]|uniref:Uncharacterized protein n=1 Tax=Phialocephala subalpina TaxID=576137 RepID=A0A1L7WQA8_9HELO|nr:uncharacterized protein PAC_04831 [Phialocephala subalpina]